METAGNRVWSPAWEHEWVSNGIARNRPSPRFIALTSPPPCNCRHPRFCQASHSRVFFGEADFFSAKRLFFRAARDVSGVRSSPPWARVVIKLKMSFQALSHSPSHDRALALTSPPPDFLFSSIHQNPTIPPKNWNIPYWYCLP